MWSEFQVENSRALIIDSKGILKVHRHMTTYKIEKRLPGTKESARRPTVTDLLCTPWPDQDKKERWQKYDDEYLFLRSRV